MLNKIKTWIKEYALLIIAILILVIMLKSCTGNAAERRFIYTSNKYEYVIDSLENVILGKVDTIYKLNMENDILKGNISDIRRDKEYYMRVNNNLVNVTKNLSKRDTIK